MVSAAYCISHLEHTHILYTFYQHRQLYAGMKNHADTAVLYRYLQVSFFLS